MEAESQTQRVLDQFTLTRGRKRISVKIYAARSEEQGGKPYVVRDLQGKELPLNVGERIGLERRLYGTADAADLYRKGQQKRFARLVSAKKRKAS